MISPIKTVAGKKDALKGGKADEPMTEVQAVRLRELCEAQGEPFDGNLTRGQAQARIEALEEKSD